MNTKLETAFATFVADNVVRVHEQRWTKLHNLHRLFVAYVGQNFPDVQSVTSRELIDLLADHGYAIELATDRWGATDSVIPGFNVRRGPFKTPGAGA